MWILVTKAELSTAHCYICETLRSKETLLEYHPLYGGLFTPRGEGFLWGPVCAIYGRHEVDQTWGPKLDDAVVVGIHWNAR